MCRCASVRLSLCARAMDFELFFLFTLKVGLKQLWPKFFDLPPVSISKEMGHIVSSSHSHASMPITLNNRR